MGEPGRRTHGEHAALAIAIFAGLLVLYVLSIGPAVRFCDGTSMGRRVCEPLEPALRVVYAPLIWAHDVGPMRRVFDWYIEDVWGAR